MGSRSLVFAVVMVFGCAETDEEPESYVFGPLETSTHEQINAYRVEQGLAPLTLDPIIGESARGHSEDMLSGSVDFGHDGFDQRVEWIADTIAYVSAGENVAWNQGYDDPVGVAVQGWIDSPPHHENMVGDYDLTGIGVATGPEGRVYFTQIFVLTP